MSRRPAILGGQPVFSPALAFARPTVEDPQPILRAIEATLDSLRIDATLACLKDTRAEVGMLMNDLGNIQGDIGGLKTSIDSGFSSVQNQISETRSELRSLLAETIRLLKEPQGRREGFNE